MSLIQAGLEFSFDYTAFDQDASLFVAAKVYDVTSSPSLVATVPMSHVANGSYVGKFTGTDMHNYVIVKSVYTDGTYTTTDSDRSPGSESFQCILFATASALDIMVARLEAIAQILNGKAGCGISAEVKQTQAVVGVGQRQIEARVTQVINLSC
jgi:hypothetical protein